MQKFKLQSYPSSLFALCAGPPRDAVVGSGVGHVTVVIGDVVAETVAVVALEIREVVPKIVGGAEGDRNSLPCFVVTLYRTFSMFSRVSNSPRKLGPRNTLANGRHNVI